MHEGKRKEDKFAEMQDRINNLQKKLRKLEFLLARKDINRKSIEWDREEDCAC